MTSKPMTIRFRYVEEDRDLAMLLAPGCALIDSLLSEEEWQSIEVAHREGKSRFLAAIDAHQEIVGFSVLEDRTKSSGPIEWRLRSFGVATPYRRCGIGTTLISMTALHQLVWEASCPPIKALVRRDGMTTVAFLMKLGIVPGFHLRDANRAEQAAGEIIECYLDRPDAIAPKYATFLLRQLEKKDNERLPGELRFVFSSHLTDHPEILRAIADGTTRFSDADFPRFPACIVHL